MTPHDNPPANPGEAIRLLLTVRLLSKGWHSIADLEQRFGTVDKTIRRDLAVIHKAGYPLRSKTLERGKKLWTLKPRPRRHKAKRRAGRG